MAGKNIVRWKEGKRPLIFPEETAIGALLSHIISAEIRQFQPMNINFGLFPPLKRRNTSKFERNREISARALAIMADFLSNERN